MYGNGAGIGIALVIQVSRRIIPKVSLQGQNVCSEEGLGIIGLVFVVWSREMQMFLQVNTQTLDFVSLPKNNRFSLSGTEVLKY